MSRIIFKYLMHEIFDSNKVTTMIKIKLYRSQKN